MWGRLCSSLFGRRNPLPDEEVPLLSDVHDIQLIEQCKSLTETIQTRYHSYIGNPYHPEKITTLQKYASKILGTSFFQTLTCGFGSYFLAQFYQYDVGGCNVPDNECDSFNKNSAFVINLAIT